MEFACFIIKELDAKKEVKRQLKTLNCILAFFSFRAVSFFLVGILGRFLAAESGGWSFLGALMFFSV